MLAKYFLPPSSFILVPIPPGPSSSRNGSPLFGFLDVRSSQSLLSFYAALSLAKLKVVSACKTDRSSGGKRGLAYPMRLGISFNDWASRCICVVLPG